MRNWISLLLLAALPAFAQPVMKTVELEWEEVPNAEAYIVKLTPKKTSPDQPAGEPIYFTTKEARLVENVPVGSYDLQIRSRSKEADVFSKWSEPAALEVLIKEVKPLSPADKAVIEAKGKLDEVVEFKWTPVDKVKEYTITIWTNETRDKPLQFKTRHTSKQLNVKTGRDYFWQVAFESATDVSYAQMPPIFTFTLVGPKLIRPLDIKVTRKSDNTHEIAWSAAEDAREYQAKLYFRFLDEKEYKPLKQVSVKSGLWAAGVLAPGAYKFEVVARAPSRVDSDPSEYEFTVKPTETELWRPSN